VRERVAKNETRIEDIRDKLDTLETQIAEAKKLHQVGATQILALQNTLNSINDRLQKIENHKRSALEDKDRAVIYTSLCTIIGLIIAEVLKFLA
jgi:septal ring factor EnvC (AmiA/AmiB activator)